MDEPTGPQRRDSHRGRRPRDPGRAARRLPALAAATCLLAATALGAVTAATAAVAAAGPVACNDYWTGSGGSDWSDAGSWTAGVPTASSDVCLDNTDRPGSYMVTIADYNPPPVANAITVGGSGANTVTLAITGVGGGVQVGSTLTLTDADAGAGILPTGAVTFGMNEGNGTGQPGAIVVEAGTLVNAGTITSTDTSEPGQNNGIYGDVDNTGTLTVDQGFNAEGTAWTTSGTIDIAAGTELHTYPPSGGTETFTQTGGTIANNGTFFQDNGSTFVAAGGRATGNPLTFANVTIDPSGSGSGTFHVQSGAAVLGSGIGAGYTLWASGEPGYAQGLLSVTGPVTNAGTLELGSLDGTHGTLDVTAGTFTNTGTLIFENTDNGADGLDGTLVNDGTVLDEGSVVGSGAVTNHGSFSVAAEAPVQATSYTQTPAGTLALAVTGGASPTVPELSLTGDVSLAGTLAVTTTGTARGTFSVVGAGRVTGRFAATRFAGEGYALDYTGTGVSLHGTGGHATGPPGRAGDRPVGPHPGPGDLHRPVPGLLPAQCAGHGDHPGGGNAASDRRGRGDHRRPGRAQ